MRNFLQNNYGFVLGIIAGLVLSFIPLSLLIFTALGFVYDRFPEKIGMEKKKPQYDEKASAILEKMFSDK